MNERKVIGEKQITEIKEKKATWKMTQIKEKIKERYKQQQETISKKQLPWLKSLDPEVEQIIEEELEQLANKYKNNPRFHNMEEIEQTRNKARTDLENRKKIRIK